MDMSVLDAAGQALVTLLDPNRLLMLFSGVIAGLLLGIIPGVGGLTGMVLILPFTFNMDPYAAFAVLLGMSAVTGTSDTIPAVLFGVPGTSGAQATVLDGNQMAKKGMAGRALSAAYTASLFGGLFGALLLALTIPILKPLVIYMRAPEMLALSVFGISMVATLSGAAPLRGLVAAGIGIMLAMIGSDPQTGTLRWTLGSAYLWDGLPLIPMVLGLFALPELADLAIRRASIAGTSSADSVTSGMVQGARDTLRNWWLVIRCGAIGAGVGALPGLGASVVDWLAYGHAVQTVKGADQTFGTGDVRGVIAPESANNSITAGALVPTIAFGIPGSASMAILLGAFLVHGLVPGPAMLTKHLDVTYAMVWSIALANVLGAGICFLFSGQLAKIALLRYTLIVPTVLVIVCIGAFHATRNWGDLAALLIFGLIGWAMKRLRWPRPPMILGFVLGGIIERYLFISTARYGLDWLARPIVLLFLGLALFSMLRPMIKTWMRSGRREQLLPAGFTFQPVSLSYIPVIIVVAILLAEATGWATGAGRVPVAVGSFTLGAAIVSLGVSMLRWRPSERPSDAPRHMDIGADSSDWLTLSVIATRAMIFLGWVLGFFASMAAIGVIPTVPLFTALYMRLEGRERWRLVVPTAAGLTAFIYLLFDQLLTVPWPPTLLHKLIPALAVIPSV